MMRRLRHFPEAVGSKFVRQMGTAASNSFTFKDLTTLLPRARELVDQDAVNQTKNQTPHNLYYVKCAIHMNGKLQMEQQACLPLNAIYDAVQIAADASSAAFTARAAVRAPVASYFRNLSSCALSPSLMHASISAALVYKP